MSDIEKRRIRVETKRMLHFGKIVGPWWRPSASLEEVNLRFFSFLQSQTNEKDPVLRAAFTCLMFENNRLIVFVPHDGPSFVLLKSDNVSLTELEADVIKYIEPTYTRSQFPYFSTLLDLPDTLRPQTIGKMMIWCIEDNK